MPSTLTSIEETDLSLRRQIVTRARFCIGTPFRHQGRIPGKGLDCVGVIACVGHELGLFDYDFAGYGRLPKKGELERHINAAGFREISFEEAHPGDVLLIRFRKLPQHTAIVTDRGMLHAYIRAFGVVEHGVTAYWRQRIIAAYQFPGVR